MKLIIAFILVLFAVATARPNLNAEIVRQESDVQPTGYNFNVETSDGTVRQEAGALNNIGTDHESLSVQGSFSFVAADGQTYSVNYVADENGFQPSGAHLPSGVIQSGRH